MCSISLQLENESRQQMKFFLLDIKIEIIK